MRNAKMQGTNNKILRVLFVAAAVLMVGSCKESAGGSSGTDACGSAECKLTASDARFGDTFGFASTIDGDELLIGAENHDAVGVGSGAVYAYRRVGSEYEEIQKIVPAGLAAGDAFGSAIAIDGDVAVIGARLAKGGNGSAYVFRLVDGQWVEEQELEASLEGRVAGQGPVKGQFGRAVAISFPWIAVGAPRDNFFDSIPAFARTKMGAVSMFEHTGTNAEDPWEFDDLAGYLIPVGIPAGELFGTSVALDGPVLAVGAVGDDQGRDNSGAAFVYSLDATTGTWTLDRKLKAVREPLECETQRGLCVAGFRDSPNPSCDDSHELDNFGISVAVLGDRVVVGADARELRRKPTSCILITTSNDRANGGAYVYKETSAGSGNWGFEQRLEPADANSRKAFGRSLAFDTDVIAVGAFGDDGSGLFAGAAYIYRVFESVEPEDEGWALDTKLRASDAQRDENFGVSVGIDGERVVIGVWKESGSGPRSGAAYAFDL
jgi:hypothetical protein